MVSFLGAFLSTGSLNDSLCGAARLRIGRTLWASSLAMSMLHRKSFSGGASNGPATNFFFIQVAMVFVMISPLRMADWALLLCRGGSSHCNLVTVPRVRLHNSVSAICLSAAVHICWH